MVQIGPRIGALSVARLTDGGVRIYAKAPGKPLRLVVEMTETQAWQLLADLDRALDRGPRSGTLPKSDLPL
jgi:hypothetical protein